MYVVKNCWSAREFRPKNLKKKFGEKNELQGNAATRAILPIPQSMHYNFIF